MYATGYMDRNALLNSADMDDGNDEIKRFYAKHMQQLMSLPLSLVPSHILRNIAVILQETLLFNNEWRSIAYEMGVKDNLVLAKIQASARSCHEQELYITLKAVLQQEMFGRIISIFINSERFYVLKVIMTDVEAWLEIISRTQRREVTHPSKQSVEFDSNKSASSSLECNSFSMKNLSYDNSSKCDASTVNLEFLDKRNKREHNTLQKSAALNKDLTVAFQNYVSMFNEPFSEEGYIQEINVVPSAPLQDQLRVLIQHSEADLDIANELSAKLREKGIVAKTLADLDIVLRLDHINGLGTIFQEVDFIVPVVSENFLQQIHPKVYKRHIDSPDAMNNKLLYEMIMTEYASNGCVNFRVRPVLVPGMNRGLLIKDVILTFSFRLWGELSKLIKTLKETKELIPEYSLINAMKNN